MKNLTPFTQKRTQSSFLTPHRFSILFLLCTVVLLGALQPIQAQLNFTPKKVKFLYAKDIFANGSMLYIATYNAGLAISTDSGKSLTFSTGNNGLPTNSINSIVVNGNTIYAGTDKGLSISEDDGKTFKNTSLSFTVKKVIVNGNTIYALGEMHDGFHISTDRGKTFTKKDIPTKDGMGAMLSNMNIDNIYI